MMKKFKGVLFDFDGVIGDTMDDNFTAWKKAFGDFDIKISKKDYFSLDGYPTIKIAEIIGKKSGKNIEPRRISDLKHKYFMLHSGIKFFPFINKIVDLLKKRKIPLAVVSGADRRRLEANLAKSTTKFDIVVAGDDQIKGKPDPDPYLLAAKKLSLDPKNCIVVENARSGIQSAKAAGCFCIAIMTTLGRKELKGADKILKSHRELLNFFKITI